MASFKEFTNMINLGPLWSPVASPDWESCLGLEFDPGQKGWNGSHLQFHLAKWGVSALQTEDSSVARPGAVGGSCACSFLCFLLTF